MERSKARKERKNYSPDAEYIQKEFEEKYNNTLLATFEEHADEKDYIEEYDDDDNNNVGRN